MATQPQTGIVNIHGREYETVALRVKKVREAHPDWAIRTEIIHRDADCVVMRAIIADTSNFVLGTGHAEEFRASSTINKTSALENCETSAIGRALAAAGYGGTEFASADELKRAIVDKQPAPGDKFERNGPQGKYQATAGNGQITAGGAIWDSLTEDMKIHLGDIAANAKVLIHRGDVSGALDEIEDFKLAPDDKACLWTRFTKDEQKALKTEGAARKEKEPA